MNVARRLLSQFFSILVLVVASHTLNESSSTIPGRRPALSNTTTVATDRSSARDVCELSNSCTTPSSATNATTITERSSAEKKGPDKWRYNVSSSGRENEVLFESNNTADGLSFDIDVTPNVDNRSMSSNESKPVLIKYHFQPEENCFCDITKGGCDLNCCCDQDCLYVNRNVFQECNRSLTQSNEDSACIAKVLDSPLLCIVKDNLYSRHFYPHFKISPEIGQVDKLMMNRQLFSWTVVSPRMNELGKEEDIPRESFSEYKLGSPLLTASEGGLRTFYLPKPTLTSRDCNERKPVKFLINSQTVCTHHLGKNLVAECEGENSIFNLNVYVRNISFIKNPATVNDSTKLDCVRNCVNIMLYICHSEDLSLCTTTNLTAMTPRISSNAPNVCLRAVTEVQYSFSHNGTDGISAVRVFLLLQNITLKANAVWAFKFTTRFEWVNQTDAYEVSGYPGYQSGKAIITGFRVATLSPRENRTQYAISMYQRRERWLTMFTTNVDGDCSKIRRRNVHFERNTFAQCSIKKPKVETAEQCEQLQKKIYKILFGDYINITNVLISANGVPNVQDHARWVPLASDLNFVADSSNDTCSEIITSVKLVILHSAVGEFDKSEQMVVAAKINGTPFGRNVRNYDRLRITFSVNFYNVTAPPLRIFAEPPTYEIKLPTDFFYPFFSSARHPETSSNSLVWLSTFLAVKLIRLCTV